MYFIIKQYFLIIDLKFHKNSFPELAESTTPENFWFSLVFHKKPKNEE